MKPHDAVAVVDELARNAAEGLGRARDWRALSSLMLKHLDRPANVPGFTIADIETAARLGCAEWRAAS